MCDTKALEDAITKSGLKKGFIAEQVGLSRAGLSKKISGKTEFTASQIVAITYILQLTVEERDHIFLLNS